MKNLISLNENKLRRNHHYYTILVTKRMMKQNHNLIATNSTLIWSKRAWTSVRVEKWNQIKCRVGEFERPEANESCSNHRRTGRPWSAWVREGAEFLRSVAATCCCTTFEFGRGFVYPSCTCFLCTHTHTHSHIMSTASETIENDDVHSAKADAFPRPRRS